MKFYSGFPKTKNEIQKRLDNIVASILTSTQSDDPKILEYTLGIFKNLLKIPIDLSEQIQELVSGIISLFNVPIKVIPFLLFPSLIYFLDWCSY